ncbi:MAG: hypothetical protein ABIH67_02905 [Candidatus Uhrbacteria bacterium]
MRHGIETDPTLTETKHLQKTWQELILFSKDVDPSHEFMSSKETVKWMYKTLMQDVNTLVQDWKLSPDQEVIDGIKTEKDTEIRSQKEIEYIYEIQARLDSWARGFDHSGEKSTKWDSWPKRMQETGEYNCVGATMIGMSLLEQAGIKNYFGSPAGHAVNIVELSNGKFWYVDLRNSTHNIREIDPKFKKVGQIDVIEINDDLIDYRLVALLDHEQVIGGILHNLAAMENTATQEPDSNENVEVREAKEMFEQSPEIFNGTSYGDIADGLFPEHKVLHDNDEIRQDFERVQDIRAKRSETIKFFETITPAEYVELMKEAGGKTDAIEAFFIEDDDSILSECGQGLKMFLKDCARSYAELKIKDHPEYEREVGRLMRKISQETK